VSLGYRGNSNWRDMSDYLVHLTKDPKSFSSILKAGHIKATGPFGWLSTHASVPDSQKSCCLSEIPMDYLPRLAEQHGQFGVVFSRGFVEAEGGCRVWYLEKGSVPADTLRDLMSRHFPNVNDDDSLLELTPFIDYLNPSRTFDWEREWRVPGGLQFTATEVKCLFAPESRHADVETLIDVSAILTSLRDTPLIDLHWDEERIQDVLALVR
jgi:hypothetical protein